MAHLIDDIRKIISELEQRESASNDELTRDVRRLAATLE